MKYFPYFEGFFDHRTLPLYRGCDGEKNLKFSFAVHLRLTVGLNIHSTMNVPVESTRKRKTFNLSFPLTE